MVNKTQKAKSCLLTERSRLGFRRLGTHSSNEGPLNLRLLNSEHIGLVPLYINILKINMLQALQKKTETAGRRAGEKEQISHGKLRQSAGEVRLLNRGALVQIGTLGFWAHQTPFQEGRPAASNKHQLKPAVPALLLCLWEEPT